MFSGYTEFRKIIEGRIFMKRITDRLIAVFLTLTIVFSTVTIFTSAKTDADIPSGEVVFDETDPGYNEGKDHLTTEQFFGFVDTINAMFKRIFGFNIINENKIRIEVNGVMDDIFSEWLVKTGGTLDPFQIANCLPNFTDGSDKVCELLRIDVDTIAPLFRDKANEMRKQGKTLEGLFFDFARIYLLGIDHMSIEAEQSQSEPDVYKIYIMIYYRNGSSEKLNSDFISTPTLMS